MPAKALLRAQLLGTQTNILATPKSLLLPNKSQSTTLAGILISRLPLSDSPTSKTMSTRVFPQVQPNILATSEVLSLPNKF